MIRSTAPLLALLAATMPASAFAAPPSGITAAIADPTRPAEDRARDADRKPADVLRFTGVKAGMTVVEMFPGGGYYTRLLSDVVGAGGKVIAYVPDEGLAKFPKALDKARPIAADHPNVTVMQGPALQPSPDVVADVVWTTQNYHDLHNLPGLDVVAFDRAMLRVLKPNGVYLVLDHAAKPGTGLAATNTLHRIDPATVRAEMTAAGFVYDGETKVLANPADDHEKAIFDPAIRGHTDLFVYRFRKPK